MPGDFDIGKVTSWFPSEGEKIEAAIRQGHEICHAHFPAGIMVATDANELHWKCPECGITRYTGITAGVISLDFVEHGEI